MSNFPLLIRFGSAPQPWAHVVPAPLPMCRSEGSRRTVCPQLGRAAKKERTATTVAIRRIELAPERHTRRACYLPITCARGVPKRDTCGQGRLLQCEESTVLTLD